MKIGILTYHRSHNFGAQLQAIALRDVLQRLGNDVAFVDYWPDYHRAMYAPIARTSLFWKCMHPRTYYHKLINAPSRKKRFIKNMDFINMYINPYCKSMSDEYDVIIVGSDQVWRKQPGIGIYNPVYFGDNDIKCKFQITYAASTNVIPKEPADVEYYKKQLVFFKKISVRERELKEELKKMGYMADLGVDPALLLSAEEWKDLIPLEKSKFNEPYLLYYKIGKGYSNEESVGLLAKKMNLKLICLYSNAIRYEDETHISTASAADFLNLIRNANFIVTTSFHGTVFAIINNKPFCTYCDKGQERITSILKALDLNDRWCENPLDIMKLSTKAEKVYNEEKLRNLVHSSMEYLTSIQKMI